MKKLLIIKPTLAIACFFLLSFLILSVPAFATWIHGHSGHIENPPPGTFVRAWGLDFVPGSTTVYWIHFAIPMESTPYKARYINLKFYEGIDSHVTQVEVYDANTKVATLAVPAGSGWRDISLDMGSIKDFYRGLGISVKAEGGPDAGVGQFIFSAVGASTSTPLPFLPMLLLDE